MSYADFLVTPPATFLLLVFGNDAYANWTARDIAAAWHDRTTPLAELSVTGDAYTISERTKAALERVRMHGSASGLPIGGQPLEAAVRASVASLAASGMTDVAIAQQLGIHRTTAAKYRTR